jgi:hypothetical protein
MPRSLLALALLVGLGCGPRPAPRLPETPPQDRAVAVDSAAAATPVVATLDTVRVAGERAPEPGALRDPRTEPLFVDYASPGEVLRLRTAFPWIDVDKVRWRYAPPERADSAKGR